MADPTLTISSESVCPGSACRGPDAQGARGLHRRVERWGARPTSSTTAALPAIFRASRCSPVISRKVCRS